MVAGSSSPSPPPQIFLLLVPMARFGGALARFFLGSGRGVFSVEVEMRRWTAVTTEKEAATGVQRRGRWLFWFFLMAAKPLTTEAIALTEKKMDMTLDDIIKMSKTNAAKPNKQRASNRGQKFVDNAALDKSSKVRSFMDTRSSFRQEALAQRRSNFQGNQFPLATEAARKAAVVPIRNRAFNRGRQFNVNKPRVGDPTVQKVAANGGGFTVKKPLQQANAAPKQKPQTLDSLFANMKEQRMRVLSQQIKGSIRKGGGQSRVPWARNRLCN